MASTALGAENINLLIFSEFKDTIISNQDLLNQDLIYEEVLLCL